MDPLLKLDLNLTPVRDILRNFDQRLSLLEGRSQHQPTVAESINIAKFSLDDDYDHGSEPSVIQNLYKDLVDDQEGEEFRHFGLDSVLDDANEDSAYSVDPSLTVPLLMESEITPAIVINNMQALVEYPEKIIYTRDQLQAIKETILAKRQGQEFESIYKEFHVVPNNMVNFNSNDQGPSYRISDHFPQRSTPPTQKSPKQKKQHNSSSTKAPVVSNVQRKSPKAVWDPKGETVKTEFRFGLLVEYPDSEDS